MKHKLSGKVLKKDLSTYKSLVKKKITPERYIKQEDIISRADDVLYQNAHNELIVDSSDYPILALYIDTFSYALKDSLLAKLQKNANFNIKEYIENSKLSFWNKLFKRKPQQNSSSHHKNNNNVQKISSTANKPQPKVKNRLWNKIKIVTFTSLLVIGSAFGIKSSNNNTQSDNMSETHGWQPVTQPIERDTLNNTTNILPLSKNTKISEDTLSKHQKIWKNYYDNTIEILTSKTQRESIYNKIEHQLENEIFTLPSNISVERLAHSYLMYKEYGVKSSIGSALESSKKLTSIQQQQLINDINIAGEKGLGVKQLAMKQHKGKLKNFSRFNNASKELQQKHITNLKELKQSKKQSTNTI